MRLYDNDKKQYNQLDKSYFEPIDQDKKIYDKKFETKPIGYFKDAMIRFSKNRVNIIASSILLFLILMAVLVPLLTTKNFTRQQTQLAHLPPRVPILERLGIMDGMSNITAQTINPDNYFEIDGEKVFYPDNFMPEFIQQSSLENYWDGCSRVEAICVGGEVVLRLQGATATSMTATSRDNMFFDNTGNIVIDVDIDTIIGNANTELEVILVTNGTEYVIGTITEAGQYSYTPFVDNPAIPNAAWDAHLVRLRFNADDTSARAILNSIVIRDTQEDEPLHDFTGFKLANFRVSDTGLLNRQNAQIMRANFKYDAYRSALAEQTVRTSSGVYFDLLDRYAEDCDWDPETRTGGMPDPNSTSQHARLWPEGCPILRTIGRTTVPDPANPGETLVDFRYVVDYQRALGFETVPYFFFGTTNAGFDLFALTWVALRTSLSIGLIVALINITVGIIYGSISGYYGGKIDLLMERFSEIISRIPWLVLLSIFYALIGPGALTLILILIVSGWIGVASVTRTQFYRYKGREYVLASRTLGAKDSRLIFRHILPNGIGTIITASVLMIPGVIFTEAALTYLGFGIGHGQDFNLFGIIPLSGVSIGVLLADGRNEMIDKPYLTLFPAIIISILMITFNMFGNALRDAFNPSLRGSE